MDLAEGQGGNAGNGAHAQTHENNGTEGPAMGRIDTVVKTLESQLSVFEAATENIKTLAEAVSVLRSDVSNLKRQRSNVETEEEPPRKNGRFVSLGDDYYAAESQNNYLNQKMTATPVDNMSPWADQQQAESGHDSQGEEQDCAVDDRESVSRYMQKEPKNQEQKNDKFEELENFFKEIEDVGPAVDDQLTRIAGLGLRGGNPKQDEEKLEEYKKKYHRPANIQNLQVPKIEEQVWRKLKQHVKTQDFLNQKTVSSYNLVLVPIIKALEELKNSQEAHKAQEQVMDAFKILCLLVKSTNKSRMDRIKREMLSQYRGACNNTSATNLLGDDLLESLKKLDGPKMNITTSSFLGQSRKTNHNPRSSQYHNNQNQRGGGHFNQGYHKQPRNKNNYNNNFYNNNNNSQKKWHKKPRK